MRFLSVGNRESASFEAIAASPIMATLPFVRERRFAVLPEVLFYGGLPCAQRFARLVVNALSPRAPQ
ncbi:Iron(3+)-hydroxamate-binding protein FhuD precursor [compost metagenome]